MRTKRHIGSSIYVFDSANVIQGYVGLVGGWWQYRPINPAVPLGRHHGIKAEALEEAAAWVDTLWPAPVLAVQEGSTDG